MGARRSPRSRLRAPGWMPRPRGSPRKDRVSVSGRPRARAPPAASVGPPPLPSGTLLPGSAPARAVCTAGAPGYPRVAAAAGSLPPPRADVLELLLLARVCGMLLLAGGCGGGLLVVVHSVAGSGAAAVPWLQPLSLAAGLPTAGSAAATPRLLVPRHPAGWLLALPVCAAGSVLDKTARPVRNAAGRRPPPSGERRRRAVERGGELAHGLLRALRAAGCVPSLCLRGVRRRMCGHGL